MHILWLLPMYEIDVWEFDGALIKTVATIKWSSFLTLHIQMSWLFQQISPEILAFFKWLNSSLSKFNDAISPAFIGDKNQCLIQHICSHSPKSLEIHRAARSKKPLLDWLIFQYVDFYEGELGWTIKSCITFCLFLKISLFPQNM